MTDEASSRGSPTPGFRSGPRRGRGVGANPANRFLPLHVELDPDAGSEPSEASRTWFGVDASRSIISRNESADVGFAASVNPYRGCEHGCAYCYARPTHEYLGFSAGLDFETKILVKREAPRLLRKALSARGWTPQVVALSGVTDCYQPVERRLRLTRGCLEVLAQCRNPVVIITKNHLVTRDVDVLAELARHQAVAVFISITSLDAGLCGKLEPRTSRPRRRLAAIETLSAAGVPTGVMVAPLIPGLTDHEMPDILAAAAAAGARHAGRVVLRLPGAVQGLFEEWLEDHVPQRKEKVLSRLRSLRGGRLNDSRFGTRMRGEGPWARHLADLFRVACRKAGIEPGKPELSCAAFIRPSVDGQLGLFV